MPVMPCKSLFGRLSCGMGGGWRAALVGRTFRGTALHMGKGAGNSGAPRTRPRGAGCRGGSIPGFTCRRRTGCGCAAQFCLTPQMGAGDGPGQEAQPHPASSVAPPPCKPANRQRRWRLLCRSGSCGICFCCLASVPSPDCRRQWPAGPVLCCPVWRRSVPNRNPL